MLIVRADTSEMLVTLFRMSVAQVHQLTTFAILASGNLMADRGKFDSGRYATIALCAFSTRGRKLTNGRFLATLSVSNDHKMSNRMDLVSKCGGGDVRKHKEREK
jgi:hypothetical protein